MFTALKYKLKHQNSLYHKLLENLSIHVVVMNKYNLIDDIPLKTIHDAIISPRYTIKNLIKDLIKYLKYHYHRENYFVYSLDYDDEKHNHFHYLSFSDQYKKISDESLIDTHRHIIKEHLTISFKILCKIKVPIKIMMKNHKQINHKEIEMIVPYSNKYCIKQLIDDTKKYIDKIYKNKMYIHSFEMKQNLSFTESNIANSWNVPLLYHKLNDSNHLESLDLQITLKHKNRKKVKYKKPTKLQKCWYIVCF